VRELENVLTRVTGLCDRDTIELSDLTRPGDGVAERISLSKITRHSTFRGRFSRDDPARLAGQHQPRRGCGEEEPPGILGAMGIVQKNNHYALLGLLVTAAGGALEFADLRRKFAPLDSV
jgi:hypothetical protein